jgi:hypothetical protein
MKLYLLLFLTGFSFIYSCKKEDPVPELGHCIDQALIDNYTSIWKSEFLRRNKMTEDYFNAHIMDVRTSSSEWNSGISFRVDYFVIIDWAKIKSFDDFLVKFSSKDDTYQYLNIPRDTFLGLKEIQLVMDKKVWSKMQPIKPVEKLLYPSEKAALSALHDSLNNRYISDESLRYTFDVPGQADDGFPYMIGRGTINHKENKCYDGHINLITGEPYGQEDACWVN